MRAIDFIQEARRNPEQNPKTSVNEYIEQALAQAEPLGNTNFKNLFVSFTKLPKLGINPQSRYNTPIGIYSYPAEYVIDKTTQYGDKSSTLTMASLPFAGSQPWANIFRARDGANIINLNRLSEAEYNDYCEKLIDLLTKIPSRLRGAAEVLDRQIAEAIVLDLMEKSDRLARVSSYGGKLWYITYALSENIPGNKPVVWTSLFRRIGIDGCVDPDTSIIHPSEPTQAVFFGGNVVDLVATVPNKYNPRQMASRVTTGKERHEIFVQNIKYLRTLLKGDWENPNERLMALNNFIETKGPRAASIYFKRIDPKTRLSLIEFNSNLFRNIYIIATGPEFAMAFVRNPRLIGNIDSIKPYVSVDEFKKLLKQIKPNMAAISDARSREIAVEIFSVLNSDNLVAKDNELMKLLIDVNPRIWTRLYSEFGTQDVDKSVYEYALKVLRDRNYSESAIFDVESLIDNSY